MAPLHEDPHAGRVSLHELITKVDHGAVLRTCPQFKKLASALVGLRRTMVYGIMDPLLADCRFLELSDAQLFAVTNAYGNHEVVVAKLYPIQPGTKVPDRGRG